MSQSPRRVLTPKGKKALLDSLMADGIDGFLYLKQARLVNAVTINVLTDEIEAVTVAGEGVGTGVTLELFTAVATYDSGKVAGASLVLAGIHGAGNTPVTVTGVMIGTDATKENALVYLDFDAPVTLDEPAEAIQYAIEWGFDGQTFYVVPRVLPIGE